MGLLIECPGCKKRSNPKRKVCRCGVNLARISGRIWWIEYYDLDRKRKRERIGPNKEAAEKRYRDVLNARVEGRHIQRSPDLTTRFKDLAEWYLELPEVKAKRSYDRDRRSLMKLEPYLGERLLKDITPALVEAYRQKRLKENSYRGHPTKPATINRELACLKTIFNKAIRNGKAERNPVQEVTPLKENNVRDRVISQDEYELLVAHSPDYLAPIVKVAYHTGMRRGEILNLTWDKVDLKEGFIRLRPEDTKTNEARNVPLSEEVIEMFKAMPRGLPGTRVFTLQGKPISCIREGFESACHKAGIENFTFHDLRHTYVNDKCREGHPYFVIMASTGHKTTNTFKRYNTISEADLKMLVKRKSGAMDTYMDTKEIVPAKRVGG